MKQHEYQISVKHVKDQHGEPSIYTDELVFAAYNHYDIFQILERLKDSDFLEDEKMKAFIIGLKLFGETLLENKDKPLFKAFLPQFIGFVKEFKATSQIK